jgi:hypothetical protein
MFYPSDWRKDQALQACTVAVRGVWHEMLCLMHECQPYGHLTLNGRAMPDQIASRLIGCTLREYKMALRWLEDGAILSRTAEGIIYSRRMVRDEAVREARAIGGIAGKEHGIKGKEYGAQGGRPTGDKEPPSNPPPSFAVAFAVSNSLKPRLTESTHSKDDDWQRLPPPDGAFAKLKGQLHYGAPAQLEPLAKAPPGKTRAAKATNGAGQQWNSPPWVAATAKLCDVTQHAGEPYPAFRDRVHAALNAKLKRPAP